MITFKWPICALLLLLPYLLIWFWRKQNLKTSTLTLRVPAIERIKQAYLVEHAFTNKINQKFYSKLLWLLLWLSITLALMRPEWVDKPQPTSQYGYDLMLAIDLSLSMNALDLSHAKHETSRLHAVKKVVADFVAKRKGDRIGLIVFAKHAYQLVPLTYDTKALNTQLQQLTVGMAGDSTSIGDAIALAVKNMRNHKAEKTLILLTDGEDTSSSIPPKQATELAAKYNIKIYTIGVGSNGLAPIRDANGQLVMFQARIDEDLLKEIANTTAGLYARASNKDQLTNIYQQIDSLERSLGKQQIVMLRSSLHRYPLAIALLCTCLLFGIYILEAKRKVCCGHE